MNILMTHFRVGETDGVSLEMDKWKLQLEKMGHNVAYLAGSSGNSDAIIIDELDFRTEKNKMFFNNCYRKLTDFKNNKEFIDAIEEYSDSISEKIIEIITKNKIELIIPNNVLSLGLSIPIGVAFAKAIDRTDVNVLCHHHDFHWEREIYKNTTSPMIENYLNKYFPYDSNRVRHVVINEIAKSEIKARKNIDAIVVPNVFDYSQPLWEKDNFNCDLRQRLGILDNDIVILQATRIADRKAIEIAIDFVCELNNNKKALVNKKLYNGKEFGSNSEIYFVLAGLEEMEEDRYRKLIHKMEINNIKYILANNYFEHSRSINNHDKKYSLWDAYTICDMVTYPSILEGWGNQFLEAIFAKKPQVIFEYPVYKTDIEHFNFNVISLGDKYKVDNNNLFYVEDTIIKKACTDAIEILSNKDLYKAATEENFNIAKEQLSYEKLYEILYKLVSNLKGGKVK